MLDLLELSNFFNHLNVNKLKKLHLSGPTENCPMIRHPVLRSPMFREPENNAESIVRVLQNRPKLESLVLYLDSVFPALQRDRKILFPTNFHEFHFYESSFPGRFRFSSLDLCRETLKILNLRIPLLDNEDWSESINRPFPALRKYSVTASIVNQEVLETFFNFQPNLKVLRICITSKEYEEKYLCPIRKLDKIVELRLHFSRYTRSNLILNSELVPAIMNSNLQILALDVTDVVEKELVTVRVSKYYQLSIIIHYYPLLLSSIIIIKVLSILGKFFELN